MDGRARRSRAFLIGRREVTDTAGSRNQAKISVVVAEAQELLVSLFWTLDKSPLGKIRGLDANGNLRKDSRAAFANGRVQQLRYSTLEGFIDAVIDLGPHQALGFGVSEFENARVVTMERLAGANFDERTVARTKDCFSFRDGPGLLHVDYDPQPGATRLSLEQLVKALRAAVPELRGVTMCGKPSSSSYLTHPDGSSLVGASGAHLFIPVMNARRIPEFGRIIAGRLWLAGLGFIKISGAGRPIETTILDQSVLSPERLCFVRATCENGVRQEFPAFQLYRCKLDEMLGGETWLDDLSPLTDEDHRKVAALKIAARAASQPEADRVRAVWAEKQAERRIALAGPEGELDRAALVRSFLATGELVLPPDLVLHPLGGEPVTAAEVLSEPHRWNNVQFADPFEPKYGDDPRIAKAVMDRGEPYIDSFAHGGLRYYFTNDEDRQAATALDFADLRQRRRFEAVPAGEFMRGEPPTWLIQGVMPKAKLGDLYGLPAAGKSFWALDLAASIALGTPWNSLPTMQADVVYICAEGVSGFRKRVEAYSTHHQINFGAALRIIGDQPNLLEGGDIATLLAELELTKPGLVVIDTLMQVMPGGDENSGVDIGKVLKACGQINDRTGAMVLLVHHAGKDPTKGARGFSGLRGAVDVEICVSRRQLGNIATITKMKDGDDDATYPFRLLPVSLPTRDGKPVSSCVVEHIERTAAPSQTVEPRGANQKWVFNAAQELDPMGARGLVPADILNVALASIPVDAGADPVKPKRDQRRAHLKRALDDLCAGGVLFLKNGLIFMYDPEAPNALTALNRAGE